jgi:hypothetical protein
MGLGFATRRAGVGLELSTSGCQPSGIVGGHPRGRGLTGWFAGRRRLFATLSRLWDQSLVLGLDGLGFQLTVVGLDEQLADGGLDVDACTEEREFPSRSRTFGRLLLRFLPSLGLTLQSSANLGKALGLTVARRLVVLVLRQGDLLVSGRSPSQGQMVEGGGSAP